MANIQKRKGIILAGGSWYTFVSRDAEHLKTITLGVRQAHDLLSALDFNASGDPGYINYLDT